MENGQEQINNKNRKKRRKVCRLLYRHMSALRGAFSVMVRDFLFHEIVGGTDPVGITAWYALSGLIGGKILRACKCGAISFAQLCWEAFFRDSACLFLHTGTALDCAGGRKT